MASRPACCTAVLHLHNARSAPGQRAYPLALLFARSPIAARSPVIVLLHLQCMHDELLQHRIQEEHTSFEDFQAPN